jgi:hypothetical protein
MAVTGIRGVVEAAIQRASSATGVDFGFLMGTAKRESGGDPTARAGTSSASGLFQFIDQTWLSTLKQHGGKHGYGQYAQVISQGADGRYSVSGDEARRAVMALKLDPQAASLMAGELASDHAAYLKGRIGRDPSAGELYAAHFLGPQGSARLIEAAGATPGASAASLFPDAAQANRPIFYREGRPATVAEVYANLTRTGGAGQAVDARPDGGFTQYASGRRMERMEQQQMMIDIILRGGQSPENAGAGQRLSGSLFSSEMLRVLSEASDNKT